MNQHIARQLAQLKWIHFKHAQLIKGLDDYDTKKTAKTIALAHDALLHIDLSYYLSESKAALVMVARASLYKKEAGKSQIIYENKFTYCDELSESKTQPNFLNRWEADNAALLKNSMSTAINLLTSLIIEDMLDPSIKPKPNRPTDTWYSANNLHGSGYLEKRMSNKYVLRDRFGGLLILNKDFTSIKHNWRESQ